MKEKDQTDYTEAEECINALLTAQRQSEGSLKGVCWAVVVIVPLIAISPSRC